MPDPIPPKVRQLGWISLFADVSSEMAYPVLPLFLAQTLKAPALALGLVEGIAEALVSFMRGWSGWHSDRKGRRLPYVQTGYFCSALGKPLLALAFAWPVVLFGRILDRFGKGLRGPARNALLAEAVDPKIYGKAFGYHAAMDTAGALIGAFLALALLAALPGQYRLIFVLAFVPGLLAWALTLRLKENPRPAPTIEEAPRPLVRFSRSYWRAAVLCLLFGLANSSNTFLLLRARELGLSDILVTLAYIVFNITFVLVSYPAGKLSDRVGRWPLIAGAWTVYALTYSGFAFADAFWIWPLFAFYGAFDGISRGVGTALVADYAPKEAMGSAMGLFAMLSGFATLAASLITGLLWDRFSAQTAFLACAGIAGLAVLLIPLSMRFADPSMDAT
ncbi:MAG TPA: MFS transporter [Fimbriimonadaceae bacterium]|nr:MFS transporter [Fimbriimonadaceae bacterium]